MNRHFSFGLLVLILASMNPTHSHAQVFLNTIKKQIQNEAERAAMRNIEQATKDVAAVIDSVMNGASGKQNDDNPEATTTSPRERRAAAT